MSVSSNGFSPQIFFVHAAGDVLSIGSLSLLTSGQKMSVSFWGLLHIVPTCLDGLFLDWPPLLQRFHSWGVCAVFLFMHGCSWTIWYRCWFAHERIWINCSCILNRNSIMVLYGTQLWQTTIEKQFYQVILGGCNRTFLDNPGGLGYRDLLLCIGMTNSDATRWPRQHWSPRTLIFLI